LFAASRVKNSALRPVARSMMLDGSATLEEELLETEELLDSEELLDTTELLLEEETLLETEDVLLETEETLLETEDDEPEPPPLLLLSSHPVSVRSAAVAADMKMSLLCISISMLLVKIYTPMIRGLYCDPITRASQKVNRV